MLHRPHDFVDARAPASLWEHVEAELARSSLLYLPFPPLIEARYEADRKAARAWNIRLTVPLGLSAYIAFAAVDQSILPDLGWVPLALRLFVITPVGFFAMWMCTRFGAAFREAFIALAITATMMIPAGFMLVSHAPLAPYTMLVVLLVSMFGNITMRLRFDWACFFTAMTLLSIGLLIVARPDLPASIAKMLVIATVTGVTFGIVANNQLERGERRGFLLTLREVLRSEQLSKDRAVFSALSLVDALTGLPNRRAFDKRLDSLITDGGCLAQSVSLLMVDVDHFKRFNDHHGHPAGDECLRRVAEALQTVVVRAGDLVVRHGGEEFAVLLVGCTVADAERIAERLCQAVRDAAIPHGGLGGGDRTVTVSVGLSTVEVADGPRTVRDLVDRADKNLYLAKRAGRDGISCGGSELTYGSQTF